MPAVHPILSPQSVKAAKPPKPYPDFPLFAHAAGVWADPNDALAEYLKQKEALHAVAGKAGRKAHAGSP